MNKEQNLTWYLLVEGISDRVPSLQIPSLQYLNQIHQLEDNHPCIDTSYQTRIPSKTRAHDLQTAKIPLKSSQMEKC